MLYHRAADFRAAFVILAALFIADCSSREQRAQSYYDSGMKLLAAQDNQKAAIEFRNAVKLKGDFLPAWKASPGPKKPLVIGKDWSGAYERFWNSIRRMTLQGLSSRNFLLPAERSIRRLSWLTKLAAPDANADLHALKAVISYKLKDTDGAIREAQAALKIAAR